MTTAITKTHTIAVGSKSIELERGLNPEELANRELSMATVKRYFEAENPEGSVKERKQFQALVGKAKGERANGFVAMAQADPTLEAVDVKTKLLKDGTKKITAVWKTKKKSESEKDFDRRVDALVTCCGMTIDEARAKVNEAVENGDIVLG